MIVRRWTTTDRWLAAVIQARKWPSSCLPCPTVPRTQHPGPILWAQNLRSACRVAAHASGTPHRRTVAGPQNSPPSYRCLRTTAGRRRLRPCRLRPCSFRRPSWPLQLRTSRSCSVLAPSCAAWPRAPTGTASSTDRFSDGTSATLRNKCLPAAVQRSQLSERSSSTRSETRIRRDLYNINISVLIR